MFDLSNVQTALQSGIVGSYVLHASIGAFFAASGFNKLTNKSRHANLVQTLKDDRVPFVQFCAWWVPGWEVAGGAALVFNVLPAMAAAVLLVIMLVAIACEAPARVKSYAPINRVDVLADWLYLPEVLYGVILLAIVLGV